MVVDTFSKKKEEMGYKLVEKFELEGVPVMKYVSEETGLQVVLFQVGGGKGDIQIVEEIRKRNIKERKLLFL